MISNSSELYEFLDRLFEAKGFIRKKDTYYLDAPESICFFSIGKSELGGKFDHVMGCFLKSVLKEGEKFPKYNKSHLKFSLRGLADPELVKRAFDFEHSTFKGKER